MSEVSVLELCSSIIEISEVKVKLYWRLAIARWTGVVKALIKAVRVSYLLIKRAKSNSL